jgi:hypothetical protein
MGQVEGAGRPGSGVDAAAAPPTAAGHCTLKTANHHRTTSGTVTNV